MCVCSAHELVVIQRVGWRRGDPGGPPAIHLSPRLMVAPTGTPTISPKVARSFPRVGIIDGHELRATGDPQWREGWHHCVIFGRCYCVLPWFCYKQACSIARPKYNFGIAVKKFRQAFFAVYKILWILTSLAST